MSLYRQIFLCTLLISACRQTTSEGDPDNRLPRPTAIGRSSETRNVRWIKGEELGRLARANGDKGTLFNVWATWCGSCKGEFPTMRQIAADYASRGVHVVPISVDEPEQMPRLVDWAQARGFAPPAWIAARPLDVFKASIAANWLGNIPITLLYDSQGKRRFFWNGPIKLPEVTMILDEFVAGKAVDGEKHYALSAGITEPSGTSAH